MKSKRRIKLELARKLRKDQTKAEERLWWIIRNRMMLGHKFRRQYIFRGFVLDFYCPKARLGIELDGPIHLRRRDYDQARQNIIERHCIKILRFKNEELFHEPEKVLQEIINNLPLFPALSSKRRGGTIPIYRDGG